MEQGAALPSTHHPAPPAPGDSECNERDETHSRELWGELDSDKVSVDTQSHMGKSIRFKASSGITKRVLFITTPAFLCQ